MNINETNEIKLEIEDFKVRPLNKILFYLPLDFIFAFTKNFVILRVRNNNDFDIDESFKVELRKGVHDSIHITSDPMRYQIKKTVIDIHQLKKDISKNICVEFYLHGKGQTHLTLFLNPITTKKGQKIIFGTNKEPKEKYLENGAYYKVIRVFYGLEILFLIGSILSFSRTLIWILDILKRIYDDIMKV